MGNSRRACVAVLGSLLSACTGAPDVPGLPLPQDLPALGLGDGAGTLAWRGLDQLDTARITLPAPDPAAAVITGTFPLDGKWTDAARSLARLRVFQHPLPFLTDMPRPNYAPMGARLFRGDTEIPFVNDPEDLRGGGWFIENGVIQLLSPDHPERWPTPPRMQVAELAAKAAQRHWSGVGSQADFVRTEVTVAGITRTGIQLPPAAEITFPLLVPAQQPTLDFGVVVLPPLLAETSNGGATVTWSIDGELVGSASVSVGSPPRDERINLQKWAGKQVTLTYRATGEGSSNVVVTSPTLTSRTGRPPRHVVLVGIDTLRQDALGLYGYGPATSPELDAWAAQSVVFDAAWAPAPRTRPSFRTALTGRYPLAAAAAPTVAEAFAANGFRTAGVVANVHLVPRFGFNDGFEHWHYENGAKADVEIDRALAWQRAHADEDTFLFLHLMDPHTFYDAPAPYGSQFQTGSRPARLPENYERWQIQTLLKESWFGDTHKRWIRGAYDGEVAWVSAQLGRFFTALEAIPGRTVTAVHSDHGEEFFEHGGFEHNHSLYEELVRAALWIRAPGGQSGGTRVAAPVGLIDLAPTLLDLVGVPPVLSDGRSLAAYVDPAREAERTALTAALNQRPLMIGHLMFGKERWAVVSQGWKYILHTGSGQEEVYNLQADRGEQTDLVANVAPERLEGLRRAMADASGWPVRQGWRVRIEGPRRPIELLFEAPIADAGIIDPEAERDSRANLEWGERPEVSLSEVGTVVLSPDKRSVRFLPGPRASGHQLYVSCDSACPTGTVSVGGSGGKSSSLLAGPLAVGELRLEATPGTLLHVPPADEVLGTPESAQMHALEALGYIDPG